MSDIKVKKMKIKIYTLWAIILIGKPLLGQNVTLAMCLEAAQKTASSTEQKEIEQELGKLTRVSFKQDGYHK